MKQWWQSICDGSALTVGAHRSDGQVVLVGPCRDPLLHSALHDLSANRSDVIWHGPCTHSRTLELISEADCMVLPTFHSGEGYPGVILEALVRAKPVITCALCPIVDLFSSARTSLLIPPRNPNALAEAMISVAESDELRPSLAKHGRPPASGGVAVEV